MFRYAVAALALVASLQVTAPDDLTATLARAERLYYDARFAEAIDLLLPIDAGLSSQAERLQDQIKVKLQLALAYIGLGETSTARSRFGEITDLDPNYSLDPKQYSDKVIALFDEVRQEHNSARCRTICMEGDRLLDVGDAQLLLEHIRSSPSDCVCLQATALDAADHFYQQGLEAYQQEDYTSALENFRFAVEFRPENNLATSYIQLTLDKLRVAADQLFLEWRRNFEAHSYPLASALFHRLQSANIEGSAKDSLNQAAVLYRDSLSQIVQAWKQACANSDPLAMDSARLRAADLLPEPGIASDLLAQMQTCSNKKCLQMESRVAMARLKTRVDPEIPAAFQNRSLTVRVQARIDEEGNVKVQGVRGANPVVQNAVKAAVERWKFLPAIVDKEARCVETEIPIAIHR